MDRMTMVFLMLLLIIFTYNKLIYCSSSSSKSAMQQPCFFDVVREQRVSRLYSVA